MLVPWKMVPIFFFFVKRKRRTADSIFVKKRFHFQGRQSFTEIRIILTLLMPGKDNRKNCDSTSNTRWCQYGRKDIKYRVVPIWHKGYLTPDGVKMAQAGAKIGVVRFRSQVRL